MNTNQLGTLAVGRAIAYFTTQGYTVSLPINDTQKYDLVVEIGGFLKKVQVKTSNYRARYFYVINLATVVKKNNSYINIKFQLGDYDLLYAYTPFGEYLIPAEGILSKRGLTLNGRYDKYLVKWED